MQFYFTLQRSMDGRIELRMEPLRDKSVQKSDSKNCEPSTQIYECNVNGDMEEPSSKVADVETIIQEKQISLDKIHELEKIISEAKAAQNIQQTIVQNCEKRMMELQGNQISRRDYMFGIVQKFFGLFLPSMYAIYGTLFVNFCLSLVNAASDLSVFWWLLTSNHPKTAYVILSKLKIFKNK